MYVHSKKSQEWYSSVCFRHGTKPKLQKKVMDSSLVFALLRFLVWSMWRSGLGSRFFWRFPGCPRTRSFGPFWSPRARSGSFGFLICISRCVFLHWSSVWAVFGSWSIRPFWTRWRWFHTPGHTSWTDRCTVFPFSFFDWRGGGALFFFPIFYTKLRFNNIFLLVLFVTFPFSFQFFLLLLNATQNTEVQIIRLCY